MNINHIESNFKGILENMIKEVVSETPDREIIYPQFGKKTPIVRDLLHSVEWIGSIDETGPTISID